MKLALKLLLTAFVLLCRDSSAQRLKSDKSVLNICMDGKHHLMQPKSHKLYGICEPWGSKTCCTNATAFHTQNAFSKLYNLNLNHCNKTMSKKCQGRFFLSSCFYECSPNVGPWLIETQSKIRNERFFHVPLCAEDCINWWEDCKDDFTCVENWSKGFDWTTGTNRCPSDRTCRTFKDMFKNSTNFCETVFPGDFKVQEDNSECMKFNFSGSANPNAKVAENYAKKMNMTEKYAKKINVTIASSPGTEATTTIDNKNSIVLRVALPITLILLFIVIGIGIYKGRDYIETSKRAGTKFCPWFKKGSRARHSVLHHQNMEEDQQFLQDNREDSDYTPHGALEIDL